MVDEFAGKGLEPPTTGDPRRWMDTLRGDVPLRAADADDWEVEEVRPRAVLSPSPDIWRTVDAEPADGTDMAQMIMENPEVDG